MIGRVYTFFDTDDKGVYYHSDDDFDFIIRIGEKCMVTTDEIKQLIGTISEINDDDFVLDTGDKKVLIQCENIYDIHCEEEIGCINMMNQINEDSTENCQLEMDNKKELYMRANNTAINHLKYELQAFISSYFFVLPITLIVSYVTYGNIAFGFIMPFAFVLLLNVIDFRPYSFNDWLEDKWKEEIKKK